MHHSNGMSSFFLVDAKLLTCRCNIQHFWEYHILPLELLLVLAKDEEVFLATIKKEGINNFSMSGLVLSSQFYQSNFKGKRLRVTNNAGFVGSTTTK